MPAFALEILLWRPHVNHHIKCDMAFMWHFTMIYGLIGSPERFNSAVVLGEGGEELLPYATWTNETICNYKETLHEEVNASMASSATSSNGVGDNVAVHGAPGTTSTGHTEVVYIWCTSLTSIVHQWKVSITLNSPIPLFSENLLGKCFPKRICGGRWDLGFKWLLKLSSLQEGKLIMQFF